MSQLAFESSVDPGIVFLDLFPTFSHHNIVMHECPMKPTVKNTKPLKMQTAVTYPKTHLLPLWKPKLCSYTIVFGLEPKHTS